MNLTSNSGNLESSDVHVQLTINHRQHIGVVHHKN